MKVYRARVGPAAWSPVIGAGIGVVGASLSLGDGGPPLLAASVFAASVVLFSVVGAVIVLAARTSRLAIDGRSLEHRRLGPTRRMTVGPGWRLVEYRSGTGRTQRWQWALLDPENACRLLLGVALWPFATMKQVFDGTGVVITSADALVDASPIDSLSAEQLDRLSDAEIDALIEQSKNRTLPPFPTRVVES